MGNAGAAEGLRSYDPGRAAYDGSKRGWRTVLASNKCDVIVVSHLMFPWCPAVPCALFRSLCSITFDLSNRNTLFIYEILLLTVTLTSIH